REAALREFLQHRAIRLGRDVFLTDFPRAIGVAELRRQIVGLRRATKHEVLERAYLVAFATIRIGVAAERFVVLLVLVDGPFVRGDGRAVVFSRERGLAPLAILGGAEDDGFGRRCRSRG